MLILENLNLETHFHNVPLINLQSSLCFGNINITLHLNDAHTYVHHIKANTQTIYPKYLNMHLHTFLEFCSN